MSNIDSEANPETRDRFKTSPLLIRLLLKIAPTPAFSAAC